ncbi:cysteine protease [Coemansia sp. Benny D115]|nr:cysteine protease [Coemansia sp. Benny D115]
MSGSKALTTSEQHFQKLTDSVRHAIAAEKQGIIVEALGRYNDALRALLQLASGPVESDTQASSIEAKFGEYADRVGLLLVQAREGEGHAEDLGRAREDLAAARRAKRRGEGAAAMALYVAGIGVYQQVLRRVASGTSGTGGWARELRRYAGVCLREAEGSKEGGASVKSGDDESAVAASLDALTLGEVSPADGPADEFSYSLSTDHDLLADHHRLSAAELAVVRHTSHVNGLTFLPWVAGDATEGFAAGGEFRDKDGLPVLSAKQQRRLAGWQRAGRAAVFACGGSEHIVQETVTDCSFVAALCAGVEHERRWRRRVVTRHVFPRDAAGAPTASASGRYVVRLFVNGLWRRVVIDDLLPVGSGGRLLCTHSTRGDAGPSLAEKAFLKVMGGYDFPGSNASTDLHVLTGWIPEHIFIGDAGFDADATWARLRDGVARGSVLATVATGEMGAAAAAALGLVPAHAYAVLDVREACGVRLLQVRNPWRALRWTGAYSPTDAAAWTPELRRALSYDPDSEQRDDRGLFWIDYASVCRRFDAVHLNWDPRAFAHAAARHFEWRQPAAARPRPYSFADNPQFSVSVGGRGTAPVRVWVLLSKHLLRTGPNTDYIALHVFAGGERVHEPRAALRIGEYVNAPHVLVQLAAVPGDRLTLVVAQRDRADALFFTLRVLSDAPLVLADAPCLPFRRAMQGQWASASAGGNTASPRYLDNPQFRLTVAGTAPFSGVLALDAAQRHPVNLRVFRSGFLVTRVLEVNTVASSGAYRAQYCTCTLRDLPPASYTVVASTYEPFQFSRFELAVDLDADFALEPIAREGAGMRLRELHGRWVRGSPPPRFLVHAPCATTVLARLQTPGAEPLPLINVAIFAHGESGAAPCASSGSFTNSPQGVATQMTPVGGAAAPADYVVVPSVWDCDETDAAFVLYFYSTHAVDISRLAGDSQ